MTWTLLSPDSQPVEHQPVAFFRLTWMGDEHGWVTGFHSGRAEHVRPALGHEGWRVSLHYPGSYMILDDPSRPANLDPLTPADFDRSLLPAERSGDHIYWRPQ
jgi:hypothetical protein